MKFELWILFLACVAYLLLLFLIAYGAERGIIPARIARHPLTYVLSLGVYATSWTYTGSVGFAQTQGYNFLTIYLGVTLAFALTPVLLMPILRLTRDYQLTSIADLFAFRFRHQATGVIVTLFMLIGLLPYISLQIRAVTESLRALTLQATPAMLAFGFCAILILFAILFGARHASAREKHEGLVVAIAFESAVKLVALAAVGGFAIFGLFGGIDGMDQWLTRHPGRLEALYQPVREGPWMTLMLLAFAAAFLLPRQFHMAFTENIDPRTLPMASWAFPLFLLLLNLPIVPILWAGAQFHPGANPDYYVLGITLVSDSAWLSTLAFVGGVSAASSMMIVETLALAAMCLNHLILPMSFGAGERPYENLYDRLLWWRRLLIAVIILAGYGFYRLLEDNQSLVELGLISFVAVAQFLPGVLGLLYWRRATRVGFISGLLAGGIVWGLALLLPLFERSGLVHTSIHLQEWFGASGDNAIVFGTFWSLAVNSLLFAGLSLATRLTHEEADAARACAREMAPPRGFVATGSAQQLTDQLARVVGPQTAEQQVRQALADLQMSDTEQRPTQLHRLRERIERNLSGLIGPLLAGNVVKQRLRFDARAPIALADTMRFIEDHLQDSRTRLEGVAAELDALRRYHREILQELPLAVCSLSPAGEVVIWNHAMEVLSGLAVANVSGAPLAQLTEPWGNLLRGFIAAHEQHLYKLQVNIRGRSRCFNLHKAAIEQSNALEDGGGMVILVEDLTERQMLEAELAHSERLASIGQIAAGVAHEIGNPLTGIASLAQNLRDESDPAIVQESIALIQQQIRRISDIVQLLVTFSHGGVPTDCALEPVALSACVEEAVRLVRLSRARQQVHCVNHCDPAIVVVGDHPRLVQLFLNLLTNACDASSPGDTVEVLAIVEDELVRIEVVDRGAGIPEELRERVLEPFFTTKQPGAGTGLGLPLAFNIATDHGGSMTIDSVVGRGTRVIVRLPATRTARDRRSWRLEV
ncbi:MAG: PAS domain S-box protein [Gammaproteobacteria bacterium]|nr:PAS domain S-box protein [Gammaproteobacteria bacterium]